MSYRILLVDDDAENLSLNKRLLSNAGYSVVGACSGLEAIGTYEKARSDFALVLMDHHMPEMNGDEAVRHILAIDPNQQIATFSMDDTREVMKSSFKAGVVDFIDKNADNDTLLNAIAVCCDRYEKNLRTIRGETVSLDEREKLIRDSGMIGRSQQLYDLCKRIQKSAPTTASILILGESGTGKELVAQAVHKLSARAKAPFVAINIAAEPATLLDSTLFGHKRGAFSGAIADHPGKFKQADGGTLFLDEIGDMSLDLQVKLLRVLQEKVVVPVGGTKDVPVDVRIIAATHKDLPKMVEQGTFREDLFYRINTMILKTSPLRERTDDIEPLVASYTEQICKQNGFRKHFNRNCLEILERQTWKGNIRELRSVVESQLVDSETREVGADRLEIRFGSRTVAKDEPKTLEEIDTHLESVKRDLIKSTLIKSPSKAEAARRLNIAPNRLHYFLEKFGLKDII